MAVGGSGNRLVPLTGFALRVRLPRTYSHARLPVLHSCSTAVAAVQEDLRRADERQGRCLGARRRRCPEREDARRRLDEAQSAMLIEHPSLPYTW
jgi:hypothetical protein